MSELWDAVVRGFEELDLDGFQVSYNDQRNSRFVQLYPRYVLNPNGAIHYEWLLRGDDHLEVALHFEPPAKKCLELLRPYQDAIRQGVPYPFRFEYHTEDSAHIAFVLPYDAAQPPAGAPEAVRTMATLVERTWPVLERKLPKDRSVM